MKLRTPSPQALLELEYPEKLQKLLLTPERELIVNLVITRDSGEIETFNAYRVQHDSSRGPYKVHTLTYYSHFLGCFVISNGMSPRGHFGPCIWTFAAMFFYVKPLGSSETLDLFQPLLRSRCKAATATPRSDNHLLPFWPPNTGSRLPALRCAALC